MNKPDLAGKASLPPPPGQCRMRSREKSSAVRGYSVDMDPAGHGGTATGFSRISLERCKKEDVRRFVAHIWQMEECSAVTGAMDFQLRIAASGWTAVNGAAAVS